MCKIICENLLPKTDPSFYRRVYRFRPHLCSLFVDLRPVWLQSDDSVELVQRQVSILYVLAERQLERRYLFL